MKKTSIERRTLIFALLGLAVWSLAGTLTTAYFYTKYNETRGTFEELSSLVTNTSILIDYGNGTENWHNKSIIVGSTAFDALLTTTKKVEYKMYAFGVYVSSINGVLEFIESQTSTSVSGHSWFWYLWNTTTSRWIKSPEGADQYILRPKDSTAWRFEQYSASLNNP